MGRIWPQLPHELADHIASFLTNNETACILKLINKAAAAQFRHVRVVRLRESVPLDAFYDYWARPEATDGLTLKKRRQLLCLMAASGSMQVAIAAAGCLPTAKVLQAAAEAGHLHVCQWLLERGCEDWGVLAAAARAGQLKVCCWLLERGAGRSCSPTADEADAATLDAHVLGAAVEGGHREVVALLLDCGKLEIQDVAAVVFSAAVCSGRLDVLDWAVGCYPERFAVQQGWRYLDDSFQLQQDRVTFLKAAAKACDLAGLQRLHAERVQDEHGALLPQQNLRPFSQALVLGAAAGSPTPDWRAKVEWLADSRRYPLNEVAYLDAVHCPDAFERLEWLLQRGGPPLRTSMLSSLVRAAAATGNLAALQYLHSKHGAQLDDQWIPRTAAREGHLHVLVWLYETPGTGVQLAGELLDVAAEKGDLETIDWLRARGCQWALGDTPTHYISHAATMAGNARVLSLLEEQGYPTEIFGPALGDPLLNGDLATLRYLRGLGHFHWDPRCRVFQMALEGKNLFGVWRWGGTTALRWLLELGCPVDWRQAEAAVRGTLERSPAEKAELLALMAEWRRRSEVQGKRGSGNTQEADDGGFGPLEFLRWDNFFIEM